MGATSRAMGLWVTLAVMTASGCDEWGERLEPHPDGDPFFTRTEWETIQSLALAEALAPPSDPSNRYSDDPAAARLGRAFFFDKRFVTDESGEGRSCASCHDPMQWFVRPMSDEDTAYNTTSVVDVAQYEYFTWVGRRDSLWSQVLLPVENPFFGASRLELAHFIAENYRDEYACVFEREDGGNDEAARFFERRDDFPAQGRPGEAAYDALSDDDKDVVTRIYVNYGKALAAYLRRIASAPSRFDRYALSEVDASGEEPWQELSDSEKRGLRWFVGGEANCVACHEGPLFTDRKFHNVAVPKRHDAWRSRYEGIELWMGDAYLRRDGPYSDDPSSVVGPLVPEDVDRGAYRTPSLRNVAMTAPYMHGGQFTTLEDVIEHYARVPEADVGVRDRRLWPIPLDDEDIGDIEAFLRTLTSEQSLEDQWVDPNDPRWSEDPRAIPVCAD
jgi:cytochrome c peroxidase